MDNDFGLHIIYFLQHGHWKVNDCSHQMEKVWFYNSEPSIDIQEIIDSPTILLIRLSLQLYQTKPCVVNYRLPLPLLLSVRAVIILLIPLEIIYIIYKVDGLSIIARNFFYLLSGNFKPDWRWHV
ncbi:hypothetical protein ACLB1T_09750 [Escherichia coli]